MDTIPDPGKPFEQALLDVFVTGYSSGMITTLVRMGVDHDLASSTANAEVRAMARDPGYTDDLLKMLRVTWSIQSGDPRIGEYTDATIHINPETFT